MCRDIGQGGRRCPGCQGKTALAKHNDRRRVNRAIRRNVVAWAKQNGYGPETLAHLAEAPPSVAKDWIREKGFAANDFADGIPDVAAQRGAGPAGTEIGGARQGPVPAGAGRAGGGVAPADGGDAGGGAGGGSPRAGRGAGCESSAGGADGSPQWASEGWCTDELEGQIQNVMAQQGSHRDERSLLEGSPDSIKTLGHKKDGRAPLKGSNETSRVELDNGAIGYFKPFGGENKSNEWGFGQDSAQQGIHEAAAWRLASQMGPPWSEIVPPVVIREFDGAPGSFALERPGKIREQEPWKSPEWREAAFFDCLIGQQDRHPANYLVSGDRITLIDHGFCFARPGDYKNYSWFMYRRYYGEASENVAPSRELTYQEREILQRVVSSPDLLGVRGLIQDSRSDALKARAVKMLETGRILKDF